jgi:PKD repeat protein
MTRILVLLLLLINSGLITVFGQEQSVKVFGLGMEPVKRNVKEDFPIYESLKELQSLHEAVNTVELFKRDLSFQQQFLRSNPGIPIDKIAFLALERKAHQTLLVQKPEVINVKIPTVGGEFIEVELFKKNPFTNTIKISSSDGQTHSMSRQVHYRGIIKGDKSSLVGLSIFENDVMGFVASDKGGQLNIAAVESFEDVFAIYSDEIFPEGVFEGCQDPLTDQEEFIDNYEEEFGGRNAHLDKCVRVYIECNRNLFTNKGSVAAVENYVMGIWNNVSILYQNEEINTLISEIFVWTTADPYSNSVNTALGQFRNLRQSGGWDGDLAHLFMLGGSGGGVAYLNSICSSSIRFAVSNINASYANFPNYSWTIMVVSHEMGHNLGSNHTQWCGWPGGAIDNCYQTEGSCPPGPPPTGGGTIMSYCHLASAGINFNRGFGPLPGNRIRQRVGQVSCLQTGCGDVCAGFSVSANAQPSTCGLPNGGFTLSYTGGTGPFEVNFGNTTSGQSSFSGLFGGDYIITVYDANGCESVTTVYILESDPLEVDVFTETTTCGLENGIIDIHPSNPIGSVTFDIGFGPSTNPLWTDLPSGTYEILVVDQSGCLYEEVLQLDESEELIVFPGVQHTTCGESNGQVTFSIFGGSGSGNIYIELSNGLSASNQTSFSNLEAGTYTALLIDDLGCEVLVEFDINPSSPFNATATPVSTTCGQNNGSVSFNISSGGSSQGVTFNLNNGAITGSGLTVQGLAAGNYQAILTDNVGCQTSLAFMIGGSAGLGVSTTVNDATCGLNNGSILVQTTSPAASYILNGITQTDPVFTGLGSGVYTLQVNAANGCTASIQVEIGGVDIINADLDISNALCGQPGSVTIQMPNSGNYTFDIGQGIQSSPTFNQLSAGNYTIIVYENGVCLGNIVAQIAGSDAVEIEAMITPTTCGNENGSLQIIPTAGTAPFVITVNGQLLAIGQALNQLSAGQYQVIVNDSNGCSTSSIYTIEDSSPLAVNAQISNTSCGSNNGSILLSPLNGTAPYSYAFNNVVQQNGNLTNLPPGIVNFTITDASGCTFADQAIISPSSPMALNYVINPSLCEQPNGRVQIIAAGGNAPYQFRATQGGESWMSTDGHFRNLAAGIYQFITTDSDGCISSSSITIQNEGISPEAAYTINRNNLTIQFVNTSTGGSQNTYLWEFGDGSFSTERNPEHTYAGLGAYSVCLTVTNECGSDKQCRRLPIFLASDCVARDSVILTDLFDAMGGDTWKNQWNLNSHIQSWTGLTFYEDGCLGEIKLPGNDLKGILPESLGDLSRLVVLDLSDNQISGSIPFAWKDMPLLKYIDLSGNALEDTLSMAIFQIAELEYLDLSHNQLIGSIPAQWQRAKSLRFIDFSHNGLTGAIPSTVSGLSRLEYLYLNNNNLTGTIPGSIGSLVHIKGLWLNHNNFTAMPPLQFANPLQDDAIAGFKIEHNQLTFKDILPNMAWISSLDNTSYAPQAKFGKDTLISLKLGEFLNYNIQIDEDVEGVRRQWLKNGLPINSLGDGLLTIAEIRQEDEGIFVLSLTHPEVPDLNLLSRDIQLVVDLITNTLDRPKEFSIHLFPNPIKASNYLSIDISSDRAAALSLETIDLQGRVVGRQEQIVEKGRITYSIQAPFTAGLYWLRITEQGAKGFIVKPFIVY